VLLTFTDVLTASSSASETAAQRGLPPPQLAELRAAAAALAQALLARRLKPLYFNLSSDVRGKATAALLLLAAVAATGPAPARDLAHAFDFSLSALPALARPQRGRKGESPADAAARQAAEWRAADALKRPPRAAFVAFCLALLRAADAALLPELLAVRPLVGGLLHHLASDPGEVQEEVLLLLQRRVLLGGRGDAVPPAVQAAALSDAALAQLSVIAACEEEAEEEEEEEGAIEDAEERGAGGGRAAQRRAARLAHGVLLAAATRPAHGLAASAPACAAFRLLDAAAGVPPARRRLLRWLLRLRPAESARHGALLGAATARDPGLAAALLLALPHSMEPTATGRWLANAGVVLGLLRRLEEAPAGLAELAQRCAPARRRRRWCCRWCCCWCWLVLPGSKFNNHGCSCLDVAGGWRVPHLTRFLGAHPTTTPSPAASACAGACPRRRWEARRFRPPCAAPCPAPSPAPRCPAACSTRRRLCGTPPCACWPPPCAAWARCCATPPPRRATRGAWTPPRRRPGRRWGGTCGARRAARCPTRSRCWPS
jgi:hypothetical protein